jgi:uncharacterized UPF0160 family protein
MKKLVTHSGKYHVDDLFACATIILWLEKENISYEIMRSRDPEIIAIGDFVIDIGGVYDPEINRFDHHQPGGAGVRENTIPYASFGLVWKKFGAELCKSQEIADTLDTDLVSGIDADDNGIAITTNIFPDVRPVTFGTIASSFEPSWKETAENRFDAPFFQVLEIAKGFLKRRINRKIDKAEAEALVEHAYQDASDKQIIILNQYLRGKGKLAEHPEPLFIIFPNTTEGTWIAETVRAEEDAYVNRKDFPSSWAGLRNEALANESGVADALFCHAGLWIATAKTKEGAIELAKRAIEA